MIEQIPKNKNENEFIDPDPVSIILLTLSAAGSVASIIGVIEQMRRKSSPQLSPEKSDLRLELIELEKSLGEIESSLILVQSELKVLKSIIELEDKSGNANDWEHMPFRYGELTPIFNNKSFDRYVSCHKKIHRLSGKCFKPTYDVIKILSKMDIEILEEYFLDFIDVQEKLNKVLGEKLTFFEVFEINISAIRQAEEIINATRKLINSEEFK